MSVSRRNFLVGLSQLAAGAVALQAAAPWLDFTALPPAAELTTGLVSLTDYASFHALLEQYLSTDLLMAELATRDYFLRRSTTRDDWRGGNFIVPFNTAGLE